MKTETTVKSLRRFAGYATGARWEEALDVVAGLEEKKDSADAAVNALEELDSVSTTISEAMGALEGLDEYGMEAAGSLGTVIQEIEDANGLISREDLSTFSDAFDTAMQALEGYSDLKEQDPYAGKRDDLEGQWEEASGALSALADALEVISPQPTE